MCGTETFRTVSLSCLLSRVITLPTELIMNRINKIPRTYTYADFERMANRQPSDEWVIVIDGPSYCDHRHIDPLNIMKPRFPIPEDIRKELETWYESVKKENSPS